MKGVCTHTHLVPQIRKCITCSMLTMHSLADVFVQKSLFIRGSSTVLSTRYNDGQRGHLTQPTLNHHYATNARAALKK